MKSDLGGHIPLPGTVGKTFQNTYAAVAHIAALPLFLVGFVLVVGLLYAGRDILVPFVVAFFLSYLVRPLADLITIPFARLARSRCCASCCTSYERLVRQRRSQLEAAARRQARKRRRLADLESGGGGDGDGGADRYDTDSDDEAKVRLLDDAIDDDLQPCLGSREPNDSLRQRRAGGGDPAEAKLDDGAGAGAPPVKPDKPDERTGYGHAIPRFQLDHARWERWVAVMLAALVVVGTMVLVCLWIADGVDTFREKHFDEFKAQAVKLTESFVSWAKRVFHINGDGLVRSVEKAESTLPLEFFKGAILTAWSVMADLALTLLFLIYLLVERREESDGSSLRQRIDKDLEQYILAKSIVSGVLGLLVFVILAWLDVKLAHLFGILTFVLNFIPNVGALVATVMTLPVVVLDPNLSGTTMVLAIALPVLCHFLAGGVLEPLLIGNLIILHPIIVLLAVGFWYLVWGVAGAMLSVPITAVLRQWFLRGTVDHPYAFAIRRVLEGDLDWMYGKADPGLMHTGGPSTTSSKAPAASASGPGPASSS